MQEMKNMHYIYYWDKLATKDVRKLKKHLLDWAKENPKGVLLFNTTIIPKIYNRMIEQHILGYRSLNTLEIEDIVIEWYQLHGKKGILKSIISTSGEGIIYREPSSWDESCIWYEFK